MKATVVFPNSEARTTPLGVGLATLMREPSAAAQQRLLHTAYEAGFRHFDVAPSYGLGVAERALGSFLKGRPAGVTVGTKVGLAVRGNAGLLRMVQRPARAVLRRFPALRGRATRAVGGVVHTPTNFAIDACELSLMRSLDALGVECIDLLLLHSVVPADLEDGALLEWLHAQKERGRVRTVGVATSGSAARAILRTHAGAFDVVQVPSSVVSPAMRELADVSVSLRVTHSALAEPLALARARMDSDPDWARALSELANVDVTVPGELPRLALACALAENDGGIVLLGSSTAQHLRTAPGALDGFAPEQLASAAEFMRRSLAIS